MFVYLVWGFVMSDNIAHWGDASVSPHGHEVQQFGRVWISKGTKCPRPEASVMYDIYVGLWKDSPSVGLREPLAEIKNGLAESYWFSCPTWQLMIHPQSVIAAVYACA